VILIEEDALLSPIRRSAPRTDYHLAMPRPQRPRLTREGTAEVALQIIDEKGLEGFSLEKLAQALGVKPPSLYHHFSDKADLLSEVALLMYLETPVPRLPAAEAWRQWHLEFSLSRYAAIMRHHKGASLMLRFFPRHSVLPIYERSARLMSQAGVPETKLVTIMDGLEKLTFGSALYAAAAMRRHISSFPKFDREKYPYLAVAVDSDDLHGDDTFADTIWSFLRSFPDDLSGELPLTADDALAMARGRR
jgi:TetR/AcrR family tetracycline transcriptional repressor